MMLGKCTKGKNIEDNSKLDLLGEGVAERELSYDLKVQRE